MAKPICYNLKPTKLIPNSPYPLVHYPGFFDPEDGGLNAAAVHDRTKSNGWDTQWIFRYGTTQRSHYHSKSHECMTVLTGNATIRFGVADTDENMQSNTYASAWEDGGVEIAAKAGDVFIIPAGVSHKTYDTLPKAEFTLLTPGDGHGIDSPDAREALEQIPLTGFTMIGSYPKGRAWDSCTGDEHAGNYEEVWSVPKPPSDPVLGSNAGLCELWK